MLTELRRDSCTWKKQHGKENVIILYRAGTQEQVEAEKLVQRLSISSRIPLAFLPDNFFFPHLKYSCWITYCYNYSHLLCRMNTLLKCATSVWVKIFTKLPNALLLLCSLSLFSAIFSAALIMVYVLGYIYLYMHICTTVYGYLYQVQACTL